MSTLDGWIVAPQGLLRGRVRLDGARIAEVEGTSVDDLDAWRDGDAPLIVPGFVDLHVHGGGGADSMQAATDPRAIDTLARVHARRGTTSLLATTMTAPRDEIEAVLRAIAPHCRTRSPGAARVLGVHLEGPYISREKLGAQPDFAALPTAAEILALHALAPLAVLTLAPELPGALEAIPALVAAGIRVQVGHSAADHDTACAALARGAAGFTHLFNAMSPLAQRAPGVVGAALSQARHAELIPDLLHVHGGALRAAFRAIPEAYCVSDATAAAGMPDGDYTLGRQRVCKCGAGVRLADGTLAGSALTLDEGLRNLVFALGLPLPDAVRRVATNAARYLGLADRGALVAGAWADVVQLDARLRVQRVWCEGEVIA